MKFAIRGHRLDQLFLFFSHLILADLSIFPYIDISIYSKALCNLIDYW